MGEGRGHRGKGEENEAEEIPTILKETVTNEQQSKDIERQTRDKSKTQPTGSTKRKWTRENTGQENPSRIGEEIRSTKREMRKKNGTREEKR